MSERFGKYTLLRKLGAGGMAEVFLAAASAAEGLRKLVVIKKIHPAFAQSRHFVRQFVAEAKIALGLNHPNIVQFFDFGQIGETYFLAMEHVDGPDLMALMRAAQAQGQRIPYGLAAYVCVQACMGLDYAHRKRDDFGKPLEIVHRDVSPQNVLISRDGAVQVADFGIASAHDTIEDEGTVKGKFAYMSPEQAHGERVDRRSDIFSLGIVLYELSLCRPLFGGLKGKAALDAVKRALVPRPRSLADDYPEALEEIVLRALARSRGARYQTARDLQHALSRFVHSRPDVYDAAALAALVSRVAPATEEKLGELALSDQPTQPPFPANLGAKQPHDGPARVGDALGARGTAGVGHAAPLPPLGGFESTRRERKHVVVVAGTLRAMEGVRRDVGASRARQLLLDFLQTAANVAYKHDARVLRSDDRGLLLLLGAPISTEDDSARGIRLSRALVDALDGVYADLRSPPRIGIGVQRGSALIASREGGELDIDVDPGTVERAEAISAEALGGEVLVGGGVYRLARREFAFELLGGGADPTGTGGSTNAAAHTAAGTRTDGGAAPHATSPGRPARGGIALADTDPAARTGGSPRSPKLYRLEAPLPRVARLEAGVVDLIGRELELRRLGAAFADATATRQARAVAVLGHPGLGKSALVGAFLRSLDSEQTLLVMARARASRSDLPYALLRDLLRDLLRLRDDAAPREIRRRIDGAAHELGAASDEQREVVRETLAALFAVQDGAASTRDSAVGRAGAAMPPRASRDHDHDGVDPRRGPAVRAEDEPSRHQRRVAAALQHLLGARGRQRAVVVVASDMHLADTQSLEVIMRALRGPIGPVLGVVSGRPGDTLREAELRGYGAEVIELGELDVTQRIELVMRRLAADPASEELASEIVERTGGNPLFINEMLGALEERGVLAPTADEPGAPLRWVERDAPLQVPTTVEGVIASRLDALDADARSLLTRAAVIGSRMSKAELGRLGPVNDALLEPLVGRGLLVRERPNRHHGSRPGRGSRGDADETDDQQHYAFVNELTRQVAYDALPLGERRALHQRAAARLVASDGYRSGSDDARVAWHLELAGDNEMALQSYLAAARAAAGRHADAEALRLFGRALRVLPDDSVAALEIHAERERILAAWGRRRMQLREIRRLRRVAERAGDIRWQAEADARLAELFVLNGRPERAIEPAERARELARAAGSARVEADVLRIEARARQRLGDSAAALLAIEAGLSLCEPSDASNHIEVDGASANVGKRGRAITEPASSRDERLAARAALLGVKAEMLTSSGDLRAAMSSLVEALLIWHRIRRSDQESTTLERMGKAAYFLGDVEQALAHYKRALKIAQSAGDRVGAAKRLISIGHAYAELGEGQRALPYLGKALQINQVLGNYGACAAALTTIGQLHLRQGNPYAARPMLERGLAFAEESADLYERVRAEVYLARTEVAEGHAASARERAARLVTRCHEARIVVAEAHALSAEASALAALGERDAALARSQRVRELLEQHKLEGAIELSWQRVELLRSLGEADLASQALSSARELAEQQGATLRSAQWRRRFFNSAPVRYLFEGGDED